MKIKIYKPDKFLYFFKNGKTTINMNMKTIALIIIITLSGICSFGQSRQDQTQILQKCIDLPNLQTYLPTDGNGIMKQIFINYWHPNLFSPDLVVTKGGKNVKFEIMSAQPSNESDAFLLFKKFDISGDKAILNFEFHYQISNDAKVVTFSFSLQKENNDWKVLEPILIF